MIFVDTNIFLRYVLRDVKSQAQRSKNLLEKAERGDIELWTTEWVMAELIWTLSLKKYGFSRKQVYDIIRTFCGMKGLKVKNSDQVIAALELSQKHNVGFVDAFNALISRENKVKFVFSFDKHFERFSWLEKWQPDKNRHSLPN